MTKAEKIKQGIIIPCDNCEDVCSKIEDLIATHLNIMDFNYVKYEVRSFWRTLCAFMVRSDDSAVLRRIYDTKMSEANKARITRSEFVDFMLKG